jgi:hypothetical protein
LAAARPSRCNCRAARAVPRGAPAPGPAWWSALLGRINEASDHAPVAAPGAHRGRSGCTRYRDRARASRLPTPTMEARR